MSTETFTWHYSPRDKENVFSLCSGHRYLATEGRYEYPEGTGGLSLPQADKCCVCMGTTFNKRFQGKPKRP